MKLLFKKPFWLKLIAVISMVIDHIGTVLFPHIWWFRLIGRISFPIFGYLLVTGFDRTTDKKFYAIRLAGFALVSQYFYQLAFNTTQTLNIFVTLLISFLMLWILTTTLVSKFVKTELIIFFSIIIFLLPLEYGVFGIIFIISWYFLRQNKFWLIISQIIIWSSYCLNSINIAHMNGSSVDLKMAFLQLAAPFALIIIYSIENSKIRETAWKISFTKSKLIQYGFYLFYPLHLYIIHTISILIR
jgi:hypothetical protein